MLSPEQIMTRLILTFESVFRVLAADKLLRDQIKCRTVPTPSGLSSSICGISLELMEQEQAELALCMLKNDDINPVGVHRI